MGDQAGQLGAARDPAQEAHQEVGERIDQDLENLVVRGERQQPVELGDRGAPVIGVAEQVPPKLSVCGRASKSASVGAGRLRLVVFAVSALG